MMIYLINSFLILILALLLQVIMEALLKETLNTSTLKRTGQGGGGCINQGEAFITDSGTVFVKSNGKSKVSRL